MGGYYPYYPYYSAPVYTPIYTPIYTPVYTPVYSTIYVPAYEYPSTVEVPIVLQRPVAQLPAPPSMVEVSGESVPALYQPASAESTAAWSTLNAGDAARAMSSFDDLLATDPGDARALMGKGIAAMVTGQVQKASLAFRLALSLDGLAIADLPISEPLAAQVRAQATTLSAEAKSDAAFVAAVGCAVTGQTEMGLRLASRAIELGDGTPSTAQLRDQLAYAMGSGR